MGAAGIQRQGLTRNDMENQWPTAWLAVHNLLGSSRYGERQAQIWLDLARYADTSGYQNDLPRSIWKWREWVINAYNANMPFDQFTVEQLAGDLLPNATLAQKIWSVGSHESCSAGMPWPSMRMTRIVGTPRKKST